MDCSKVQVYSNPDFSYNSLAEPVFLFPMSIRMCLVVLKKSTNTVFKWKNLRNVNSTHGFDFNILMC